MKYDVGIIGGGAAGLVAAIYAFKHGADKIIVFERMDRIGKKILATGNGRCNITNKNMSIDNFYGDKKFIKAVLDEFGANDTLKFFSQLGLEFYIDASGKIFPMSLQASSVLDVLRMEAERIGIKICCQQQVNKISKEQLFNIETSDGVYKASSLIVTTGGRASPSLGSNGSGYPLLTAMGHKLTQTSPAIVQLKSPKAKALNGIKFEGSAELVYRQKTIRKEYGEILFTEYGFSGPPILQLSAHVKQGSSLVLDLIPQSDEQQLENMLSERVNKLKKLGRCAEDFFVGVINKKIGIAILKSIGYKMTDSVESIRDTKALAKALKNWEFEITDTMSFANAQVTAGGICTSGFDTSMQSKHVKNMFAAGEILDVYGDCGGYNLQWAWSTGYIAGKNAALSITKKRRTDEVH